MTPTDIIEGVLVREGRYSDNPKDPGGRTMYGVTERTARANGYYGPMQDLPRATAQTILYKRYVVEPGFDKVLGLSARIAAELVDTGVNLGAAKPTPWLQRVLNACNQNGARYPDIAVDGQIGPATLGALKAFLAWRGAEGELALVRVLDSLQGAFYLEITESRAANEEFFFGWVSKRLGVD